MTLSLSFSTAAFMITITISGFVLHYFELNISDFSIFGIGFSLGGIMGGFLISLLFTKIKKHKLIIVMTSFGLMLSLILSIFGIFDGSVYMTTAGFTLSGFFFVGMLPVVIELGVEIAYPLDEIYS